ncbi:hypothetical protein [Dyadobacter sp. CY326]|uniref:hypothetical protein n=1 Tax=Dyadobacter sp. CY326 TaxID=2907300 RepID=UPI001F35C716|nr:hypothetical protein [Dyadobacter sp. CY326]MCE7064688.1 hypothetical protein [Dyadobacter sp. CY326]
MAETVHVRILRQIFIFQQDVILEVLDEIHIDEANVKGYLIPDVGNGSPGLLPLDSVEKMEGQKGLQDAYFGKCVLTKVSNFYKDITKSDADGIVANGIVLPEKVRVIHYPDCQQMVFHMPKFAYDAGSYQLINAVTHDILENCEVKDRLSGSTMILVDTLPYRPGFYTIEASWPDGWTHQIRFIKFMEGFPNAKSLNIPHNVLQAIKGKECHLQPPHAPEVKEAISPSSVRKPALEEHSPGNVVTYSQDGRGGKIFYRDGAVSIDFDWEFAGGNGVVWFSIPEEKFWEAHTKTPLSRRDEILEFVANQVIKDQAPGCKFEIFSNHINIIR